MTGYEKNMLERQTCICVIHKYSLKLYHAKEEDVYEHEHEHALSQSSRKLTKAKWETILLSDKSKF